MENLVLRLPEYEVLIHIKVNEFSKYLEKEIESLTATFDLEDSIEGILPWTTQERMGW